MATEGKKYKRKTLFFGGEWNPAADPLELGDENYTELENYRYKAKTGLDGVLGYSKITVNPASTAPGTYYKGRSGIQLTTPFATESYILIQAENVTETESAVIEFRHSIPATGDFSAAALHVDEEGAGAGRFASWPQHHAAYTNGKETLLFCGDAARVPAFLVAASEIGATVSDHFDFTEAVNSTLSDSEHIASMGGGGNDAYAKLLLHFDGVDGSKTISDSSIGGAHGSSVATGDAEIDIDSAVFGGASFAVAQSAYTGEVTFTDSDDFHFATGDFTIDFRLRIDAFSLQNGGFFYQRQDDDNKIRMGYSYADGSIFLHINKTAGLNITRAWDWTPVLGNWYHIALIRGWGGNVNALSLCVDGTPLTLTTSSGTLTGEIGNMAANLVIGSAYVGTAIPLHLDEFRISKGIARWTESFTPIARAYGQSAFYGVIGAIRPIQGFSVEMARDNEASTIDFVKTWNGTSWQSLSFTDATAGLSADGKISFSHTKDISKPKYLNRQLLYWYQFKLAGGDCDIANLTLDYGWQKAIDLWDGIHRACAKFKIYKTSVFTDKTLDVNIETPYGVTGDYTYAADIGGLLPGDYIDIGFEEQTCAIDIHLFEAVAGYVNTQAATIDIAYWNGDAFISVASLNDETEASGACFAQSRAVSWMPPAPSIEFKRELYGDKLYYYRLIVSAALSSAVLVDLIRGIPAQKTVCGGYLFPYASQGRPMLCGASFENQPHRVDYGGKDAVCFFNGDDSSNGAVNNQLYFGNGNALTAACGLYNRYGSSLYNLDIFTTDTETFLLIGTGPSDWKIFTLSEKVGCPAPLTMDTSESGYLLSENVRRNVALWLSYKGPVICDGAVTVLYDEKIACYFDPSDSRCINFNAIERSWGAVDQQTLEYNLGIPSGAGQTEVNCWLCLDLTKMRWFRKAPRGSACYPQAVFRVKDLNGSEYLYGLRDNGHLMRLENETTWDGEAIVQKVTTGEFFPVGDSWERTKLHYLKLFSTAISENATMDVVCYEDGASSGQTLDSYLCSGSGRYVKNLTHKNVKGLTHKISFSASTSSEKKGVPLIAWGHQFEIDREDLK